MEEIKLLGIALNEKVTFKITIDKPTIIDKLFKRTYRLYEVPRYTTLAQNIEITKLLIQIPEFNVTEKSDSEVMMMSIDMINKYSDVITKIISVLIHEKDHKFLINNLSNKDMLTIVLEMFALIDFESFMGTIALTRNKASLKNGQ